MGMTPELRAKLDRKDRTIHRTLGLTFLAMLVGAVYLTYAVFSQKFTSFDTVTLKTSAIGLNMPEKADVKVRGVIIGEVLKYATDGNGATVTLGINKGVLGSQNIPANVTGEILPKTLFGEKYVSLDIPANGTGELQAGGTIASTKVSTEVQAVLSDLYPLLKTVDPKDLNTTLTAVANALEGRGAKLGDTIATLDTYLQKLNPQIPAALDDIAKLSTVSNTYADVFPQVADILRNTITTTTTLEGHATQLHDLLTSVTALAGTAQNFLQVNGNNIIQLGDVNGPITGLLATYSSEFPCLIGGLNNLTTLEAKVWTHYTLHVALKVLPRQPRQYTPADKPVFGATQGPTCGHLPSPPWSPQNPLKTIPNVNDGVNTPTGIGTDRAPFSPTSGQSSVLAALIAQQFGEQPDQVPGLATMMMAPMTYGTEVSLK
ncbi:ABC transporter substrate-binding protein [Nocardioides baekrokdamisoli]|uniref:ABC transporter substrate-binding protein n=1 Tax=Nocardioides baekrokdamisoli TaxID=1804624 RepID=A0A3G9J004_9ACTN|nr:MCE family protein [Nocardioides baekrokdamisoli]BBH16958.1 ABC transporter substrate-binding protein [Nocardioides baekrokdamisoli]